MEKWEIYNKIKIDKDFTIDEIILKDCMLCIWIKEKGINKKVIFEHIYAYKYSNENGNIDRISKLINKEVLGKSSIYTIPNSEYIKEYKIQSSGTMPMENVVHYMLVDPIDTFIEVLSIKEPKLIV